MTARVFNTAFDLLMANEGGYVNNPHDKGGETKYGISKTAYPNIDIPSLTIAQAKEIYKRDYWDMCKCDLLPDALSVAVFDFAVNSGVVRAVKYLQSCLGVVADGKVGNQTIGAANRLKERVVLDAYMNMRFDFIQKIVANKPSQKRFLKGWTERCVRVRRVAEGVL